MYANHKKVTVTVTPEVKQTLDNARKEVFFNCSQSEMIRNLIDAGLSAFGIDNASGGNAGEQKNC